MQLQRIHTPGTQFAIGCVGLGTSKALRKRQLGKPSLDPDGSKEVQNELVLRLIDGFWSRHGAARSLRPAKVCFKRNHLMFR